MIKRIFSKGKVVAASTAAALVPAVSFAEPEGSTHAAEAFNAMQAQANEFIGYAWPIVTLLVGAFIAIKLFKKFANRAS